MTDTSAHNTHGTGGRPFNTSGIWELPPTYIQRLILIPFWDLSFVLLTRTRDNTSCPGILRSFLCGVCLLLLLLFIPASTCIGGINSTLMQSLSDKIPHKRIETKFMQMLSFHKLSATRGRSRPHPLRWHGGWGVPPCSHPLIATPTVN